MRRGRPAALLRLERAVALADDGRPLVLGGDSAGAMLAVCVALRQRVRVDKLLLTSPFLSFCNAHAPLRFDASGDAGDLLLPLTRTALVELAAMYLTGETVGHPEASDRRSRALLAAVQSATRVLPLVSPLASTDAQLQQLPPSMLQVGSHDSLLVSL